MAAIIICIVLAVFFLALGICVVAGFVGLRRMLHEDDIAALLGEEDEK